MIANDGGRRLRTDAWSTPTKISSTVAIPDVSISAWLDDRCARSATATALAATGGVARFVARGLTPATRYYYRFKVGAGATSETGTFVTAPAPGVSANLRLAFSGDADGTHVGGTPAHSFGLLDAVTAERPDVFIFLGDTIYSDSSLASHRAHTLDDYRAKYLESRTIAPMRALLRATSVIAIWDDHEVENDFDSETVNPVKFAAGHQAFVEAWPITEQPRRRLYRSFRWGKDVEVIVLDLRSYRSRQVSKTTACDNPPGSGVADLAPALPPPLPQGLGLLCAVLDRPTYAMVEVSSSARTVTITPKDAAGRPVCRAPLVITAAP